MNSGAKSGEKRLARLIECGRHPPILVSKYASDLKNAAEKITNDQAVGKQSKFFKALADETRLRILKLLLSRGDVRL